MYLIILRTPVLVSKILQAELHEVLEFLQHARPGFILQFYKVLSNDCGCVNYLPIWSLFNFSVQWAAFENYSSVWHKIVQPSLIKVTRPETADRHFYDSSMHPPQNLPLQIHKIKISPAQTTKFSKSIHWAIWPSVWATKSSTSLHCQYVCETTASSMSDLTLNSWNLNKQRITALLLTFLL